MKKIIFIISILLTYYTFQAQIVTIPDSNFKNALVNTICADTDGDGILDNDVDLNNDGEIQVSEAELVTWLSVNNHNIISLNSIQSFVNIKRLDCRYNDISSLDLTQNIYLELLDSFSNPLTSLNLTQCPNLNGLYLQYTELTSLDLTNNPNLVTLRCSSSQITNLNLTHNINLERLTCGFNQLTDLDLSQNPNLVELECSNNQLINLNIKNGNNSSLSLMWSLINPDLLCIQVDDENATPPFCDQSSYNGWCKDPWSEYNEQCVLDVTDFDLKSFSLYPNPAHDVLNVYMSASIESIKIYSINGVLVKEASNSILNVSDLKSALYIVKIISNNKSYINKFVKQ